MCGLMSLRQRLSSLAFGVLILASVLGPEGTSAPRRFTPFVSEPLPQQALGDFDGDGRSDTMFIQDGADGPHISVRLSGASDVIQLEATVAGVTQPDRGHHPGRDCPV